MHTVSMPGVKIGSGDSTHWLTNRFRPNRCLERRNASSSRARQARKGHLAVFTARKRTNAGRARVERRRKGGIVDEGVAA